MTLPAAWDDAAAAALAELAPGTGPVSLPDAAEAWIGPAAARAAALGLALPLSERLHRLLRSRRGAPSDAVWQGGADPAPRFVLNLPAFFDPSDGFDVAGFAEAVETAAYTLALAAPGARRMAVGMADLAGLLAALGLDYGSDAAQDIARSLAAILRGRADVVSSVLAPVAGPSGVGSSLGSTRLGSTRLGSTRMGSIRQGIPRWRGRRRPRIPGYLASPKPHMLREPPRQKRRRRAISPRRRSRLRARPRRCSASKPAALVRPFRRWGRPVR